MKCIVEWGRPKNATARKIVGISGSQLLANPKQAAHLAHQLFFSMTEERNYCESDFLLKGTMARKAVWSADRTFWVAVSVLDGVPRGAYAGIAEREARNGPVKSPLRSLSELYKLWDELADVIVDREDRLESTFLHFVPGTPKTEVWAWFEAQNERFIVGDVQRGIRLDGPSIPEQA